jgi:PAS domain S-box-containing protein
MTNSAVGLQRSAKQTMTGSDKVNILMVDDQPGKLLSYEAILAELGENLIKANSGKEALEHLLKTDIAVVLMDVSMPELDGFELADMIRQHPRFQKTAIIFISAIHLTDVDRLKGYARGAVDYISVPVIPDLLRAKVSVFAELHRKTHQLQTLNQELERRVLERTEELRERELEFRTLADSIPQLAWMTKADGQVFWYNRRWYDYTGITPGEVAASAVRHLCHPDHVDRVFSSFANSIETGQPWEETFPLRAQSGEFRWFLSRALPIHGGDGNVIRWFGTNTDITNQLEAEQVLAEQAELINLASEAIFVRDLPGVITFWSRGSEVVYGWTAQEALGRNVQELLNTKFPESREVVETEILEKGYWHGEIRHTTKAGNEIIVASRQALKRDYLGKPQGFLEINRDVTEQKRTENALRTSEKTAAMGRLAGTIAHEINNPLEAVKNALFLLKRHESLDPEAREWALMAENELTRISHITKQTLSFYRESQRPTQVSLSQVLEDVAGIHARRIQLAGIVLRKQLECEGRINGFPGEMRQVFLNLIGNAIEAMSDGGSLCIRLYPSVDYRDGFRSGFRISIFDTGSGIDPAHKSRIFEPFFSTKEAKGTGLGLWVTRGIVQKHEGTLQFRSFSSGNRVITCFSVFIPAETKALRATVSVQTSVEG